MSERCCVCGSRGDWGRPEGPHYCVEHYSRAKDIAETSVSDRTKKYKEKIANQAEEIKNLVANVNNMKNFVSPRVDKKIRRMQAKIDSLMSTISRGKYTNKSIAQANSLFAQEVSRLRTVIINQEEKIKELEKRDANMEVIEENEFLQFTLNEKKEEISSLKDEIVRLSKKFE